MKLTTAGLLAIALIFAVVINVITGGSFVSLNQFRFLPYLIIWFAIETIAWFIIAVVVLFIARKLLIPKHVLNPKVAGVVGAAAGVIVFWLLRYVNWSYVSNSFSSILIVIFVYSLTILFSALIGRLLSGNSNLDVCECNNTYHRAWTNLYIGTVLNLWLRTFGM